MALGEFEAEVLRLNAGGLNTMSPPTIRVSIEWEEFAETRIPAGRRVAEESSEVISKRAGDGDGVKV